MSPFLILDNRLFLLPTQPPTVTHTLRMKKVEENQQTYKTSQPFVRKESKESEQKSHCEANVLHGTGDNFRNFVCVCLKRLNRALHL